MNALRLSPVVKDQLSPVVKTNCTGLFLVFRGVDGGEEGQKKRSKPIVCVLSGGWPKGFPPCRRKSKNRPAKKMFSDMS